MSAAFGTPAQFANTGSAQTSTVTTSTSLTIALGDTVTVVLRGTTTAVAASTVSDTLGNTYQVRDASGHGGGGQSIAIYDCINAAHAGTSAISATGGGSAYIAIWAVNVAGYPATPFQAANGGEIQGGGTAGTDNYSPSSVTVATQPALFFCFLHDINAEGTATGAPVAGTGWTSLGATWQALGTGGTNAVALPIYKEGVSLGAQTAKFSLTAANKSDFFWNESAVYTETAAAVPQPFPWQQQGAMGVMVAS